MTTTATLLRQTVRIGRFGEVERGIEVPHQGANIQCHAVLDKLTGEVCHKRAGHPFRKDEKPHDAVDYRIVAAPPMVVRGRRFAPHGIPKGVDLNLTTAGHVCSPAGLGCPKVVSA